MKSVFILILCVFCFHSGIAGPIRIKGSVQEKGTGRPVADADVVVCKKGGTTVVAATLTDPTGDFRLDAVESGEYSLIGVYHRCAYASRFRLGSGRRLYLFATFGYRFVGSGGRREQEAVGVQVG